LSTNEQLQTGDIKEKIRNYIINNFLFGNVEEPIHDDDSFLETGIIDSTGILELIEYVEEMYSIKIEETELVPENLDSLNNLEKFIKEKIKSS
jgi:acyl carrier protein